MPVDSLSVTSLPINLAAIVCLVIVAVVDLRTNRVPNILTLPVLLALGAWRLWRGDWIVFVCWLGAFWLWLLHISGGGDVKVLMIELALWPSLTFITVLAVTIAVLGAAISIVRYRGVRSLLHSQRAAIARLLSGRPPSEAELRFYGTPGVFLYAAGGAVYVVLFYATRYVLGGRYGG